MASNSDGEIEVSDGESQPIIVSEANNNSAAATKTAGDIIIGQPSDPDFNPAEATVFSHNFFRRVNAASAVCLICEKYNNSESRQGPKKKELFLTTGGNTSGMYLLLIVNLLTKRAHKL